MEEVVPPDCDLSDSGDDASPSASVAPGVAASSGGGSSLSSKKVSSQGGHPSKQAKQAKVVILPSKQSKPLFQVDQDAIRPFTMPLMKLASTAIDKVPKERESIIQNLLEFFNTDAACCRDKEDSPLHELQAEVMNPLLDWMEKEFGFRPSHSTSLFVGDQPDEVVRALERALKNTNDWQLAAIDALSASAKSLVVAMAVYRGRLGIEDAIQVIRLEEDFQIEAWGLVEGGHDIDVADLKCRVAAASVFLRLF
ncbi:hypothetical protein L7F22_055977 [Adiantum nelumboides]|nr:hypothetical protein [Adiantum nelumboides]